VNKKIIQLSLFFLLVLISIIFYKSYFQNISEKKIEKKVEKEILIENQNNLIKNLRYNVNFDNNTQYFITAELSELFYQETSEFVKMQKVIAKFINEENIPLVIESDNAIYNNTNYNTKFSNNVKITYLGNLITAENLDLNFSKNIITIQNNVVYEGVQGLLKADNIKINLITKKIEIFMNDSKNKVKINSN
jgi:Organic solvent tolerance protein OstA